MSKEYPKEGICTKCQDRYDCPMNEMIRDWEEAQKIYGDNIRDEHPDIYDNYATEYPEVKDNEVVWCPMFN